MTRPAIILAALLLILAGALAFKDRLIALPEVRPASGGGFDTKQGLARLERILGDERPHPVDSAENDLVRARLIAELHRIGLTPRITDDFVCNGADKSRTISCARVRNVLATIGPAGGRHLLLVSHYDSTPVGPGAADDGIGMAVMLETAAQLRGKALTRPVSFLFNEGEEAGLLGARAFMGREPLAGRIDTLLNFEARGVGGPALMFETSRPDASAVALYARAVARPAGNSMAADFARLIPNSTDVAVLKERAWTILNFAIIGNETRYHSPGDNLAALDSRSVQHMGDQALALAADAGAPGRSRGNVNFTDVLGRFLIVLPGPVAIAGLAALLLVAAAVAWRRRHGLGRAAAAVAATVLASAALAFLAQGSVKLIRAGDYWRAYPIATDIAIYASVLLATAAALLLIARRVEPDRLRTAYWLQFAAIGSAASIAVPGAAIFFLLPALPALGAMWGGRLEKVGAFAGAVILSLLWLPLLALLGLLLRHESAWPFAPVAALIVLPWLIEAKPLLARLHAKAVLIPLAAASLLTWAASALVPAYSDDRRQMFGIEYVWDADEAQGQWMIVNDGAPLPAGYGPSFADTIKVPWSSRRRWPAPAPPRLAEAPAAELLSARPVDGGRLVSLRLRPNGAETIILRGPPEARVRAVRAGGWMRTMGGQARKSAPKEDGSDDFTVRCHGRSCDGLVIDLLMGSSRPLPWTMIGMRRGLPAAARPLVEARPQHAAPQYNPDGTIAIRRIPI